jgi:ligand-binding SRPBCC domain-containing protein
MLSSGIHHLHREQLVPRPLDVVFGFFAEAANLELITPAWLGFSLVGSDEVAMGLGTMIEYRLRLHRLPLRWVSRIALWQPGRAFVERDLARIFDYRRAAVARLLG